MKRFRLLALLFAAVPGVLHAQVPEDPGLEGAWTGAWGLGGDTLDVTMRFERGEPWVGSFDSERLRIEGIPFTEVVFEPPRVRIRMEGDATTIIMEGLVGPPIEYRVFEGADHTFRIRRPGDAWPRTVEGYPDAIVEWLRDL